MKVLDIDALAAPPEKVLKFRGKEYQVVEPTIGAFVKALAVAKNVENGKEGPTEIEWLIDMVRQSVPDMSVEVIHALNGRQMLAILDFCKPDNAPGNGEETPEKAK